MVGAHGKGETGECYVEIARSHCCRQYSSLPCGNWNTCIVILVITNFEVIVVSLGVHSWGSERRYHALVPVRRRKKLWWNLFPKMGREYPHMMVLVNMKKPVWVYVGNLG